MSDIVDEARRLLEAATPGPWHALDNDTYGRFFIHTGKMLGEVAFTMGGDPLVWTTGNTGSKLDTARKDGAFIAAAPRLVAGLLAELAATHQRAADNVSSALDRQWAAERERDEALTRAEVAEASAGGWANRALEMERDEARRERDEAVRDRDEWERRALAAERERDEAIARQKDWEAGLDAAVAQRDEARAALVELVRLKDLKATFGQYVKPYPYEAHADYDKSKPAAWAEARRIVGEVGP